MCCRIAALVELVTFDVSLWPPVQQFAQFSFSGNTEMNTVAVLVTCMPHRGRHWVEGLLQNTIVAVFYLD